MDDKTVKLIKALTELNSALLTGLETALHVIDKWDNIPDNKKEEITSILRLLVENNRTNIVEKPTLH